MSKEKEFINEKLAYDKCTVFNYKDSSHKFVDEYFLTGNFLDIAKGSLFYKGYHSRDAEIEQLKAENERLKRRLKNPFLHNLADAIENGTLHGNTIFASAPGLKESLEKKEINHE